MTGLLEPAYFESNVKSVRKEYEAYVLSIGEYDERVFLGDDAEEDIGTPANSTGTDIPEMTPEGLNREIQGCKESGSRLIPMTPLSGKHLTKDKEGSAVITPVSSSTNLGLYMKLFFSLIFFFNFCVKISIFDYYYYFLKFFSCKIMEINERS